MTVSHGALKLSGKSPHSEETQMSTSSNATGPTKPTDDQAKARADAKGHDATLAALEMANALTAIDDE